MAIPADVITGVPVCLDGTLNYTPWYINVAAALTSVLSMIGSTMIILSYICFKQMRTPARRILLHLSLMDFVVGFANFFGTVVDFNVLLYPKKPGVPSQHKQIVEGICVAQGALALFATTSSILWTIAIAVHIYLSLMRSFAKIAANCYWIVCYGLSLILTVWFASSSKLGPSPVAGSWCSIIIKSTVEDRSGNINVFFGSNLWVYIAFIIVPVVSFSLIMHSKQQMVHISSRPLVQTMQSVEGKLLAIPVIFIMLRVWSLILVEMESKTTVPCPVILSLLFLGSIGDSGQGFFNAIIYCVFNKKVRQAYFNLFCCNSESRLCCKNRESILLNSAKESMNQINSE